MKSLAVLLFVAAGSLRAASTDYFPLAPGNQWVFRVTGGLAPANIVTQTVDVVDSRSVNGTAYQVVRGLGSGELWLRSTPDGRLLAIDPATQAERLLYWFQSPEGQPYATGLPCTPTARVESRSAAFKGAAVRSEEALRIVYPDAFQCGYASETFVAGVGPVQRVMLRGPMQLTYELVYARVGGVTYGSAAVQVVPGDGNRSVARGNAGVAQRRRE